jgi:hypothetical protein
MRVLFCVFCVNPSENPPPPHFLLKYVLPPVLFTPTQVLLLITSTSTRVQIQSNLGTTVFLFVLFFSNY